MKPHTIIVILTACAVIAVLLPSANAATAAPQTPKGTWSTAQLSQARYELAAASVGNMALFALGFTGSALLSYECRWLRLCRLFLRAAVLWLYLFTAITRLLMLPLQVLVLVFPIAWTCTTV